MSTFYRPLTLIGAAGEQVTIDALVDKGATFTSVPGQVLMDVGVEPRRQVSLSLAEGSSHMQELGYAQVELESIEGPTYVVFGTNGSPPAIGAVTLEGFLLGVEPVGQRLVPVEGWQANNA